MNSKKMRDKTEAFNSNIEKRGNVPKSITKKTDKFPVGPVLLGFFLFIVVGSAIFQILNTATSPGGNSVY